MGTITVTRHCDNYSELTELESLSYALTMVIDRSPLSSCGSNVSIVMHRGY